MFLATQIILKQEKDMNARESQRLPEVKVFRMSRSESISKSVVSEVE